MTAVTFFRAFVWPYITLTREQMALAKDVDSRRNELARRFGRSHGNKGNVTPEEQLRGVQAELAAMVYFDAVKWNSVSEAQYLDDAPDLESATVKIDVKSIRHPDHHLASYKIKVERAYVAVFAEAPSFWVCGFMWGRELATMPIKELQPGRPAYCAIQSRLHDPAQLRNAVYADISDVG